MKKLKGILKSFLKNKEIVDIFIIGSVLKEKFEPKDIDIIVLFRNKNYKMTGELTYSIKKNANIENLHIEPLIIDEMFQSKIFPSIIHEGFSIKSNKRISEIMGYKACSLFTFSLEKLNSIEKVRFAQTLYGRKNDGLLQKEGGISVGRGAFMSPIEKEEFFKEALNKQKVKFNIRRVFVKY